ncbi:MAG: hypothetical protein D4R84_06705 [Rhodocyclaceae bacterium]|nr:MAG: hypothetical protein D4R84_06705 [Rhodocyclaceae bacterium]
MLLGLVTANETGEKHLIGLASAAAARGWQCRCFLTDKGVRLLRSPALLKLADSGAIQLTVCEHSWEMFGGGSVAAGVTMGSQYQNAELAHLCDRVIVL